MKKTVYKILNAKQFAFTLCAIAVSAVFIFGVEVFYSAGSANAEATENKDSRPVIIIDAGHGGEDGGASSSSGIVEKDINLSISLKVRDLLNSLAFKTVMVRDEDKLIYDENCKTIREKKVSDIHNRMSIMEANPNSIFLSIHQNHFEQSKYYGAQVFYSKNNEESKLIAEKIQSSVVEKLQNENKREVKPSGTEIYLLYNAKSPAVMVECGFLSNSGEAQLLNDENYQTKMSLAIVDGILNYLNNGT